MLLTVVEETASVVEVTEVTTGGGTVVDSSQSVLSVDETASVVEV